MAAGPVDNLGESSGGNQGERGFRFALPSHSKRNMKSAAQPHRVQHGIEEGTHTRSGMYDPWNDVEAEIDEAAVECDVTRAVTVVTWVLISHWFVVLRDICTSSV